jgi:acyl-CoA reductase-like NAD-dependent aldehyde dehydrogenase
VAFAKGVKVGDPRTSVDQGPQVDKIQFDRIMAYIEGGKRDAQSGKGRLLTGGNR